MNVQRRHEITSIVGRMSCISLGAVVLLFAGCATYHHLEPINLTSQQEVFYIDGYPSIREAVFIHEEQGILVSIYGYTIPRLLVLELYVHNATDDTFSFFPDQLVVEATSGDGWTRLKVWEANEYIRQVKRQQSTALILQAIAGGLDAATAGQSTTTTSGYYSGSYYGNAFGGYSGYHSESSTTYDQSKVAEASARNAAQIRASTEANQANIKYLNAVLLKRTTLEPDDYVFGSVYVERGIFDRYRVMIELGGEEFDFSFRLVEL